MAYREEYLIKNNNIKIINKTSILNKYFLDYKKYI